MYKRYGEYCEEYFDEKTLFHKLFRIERINIFHNILVLLQKSSEKKPKNPLNWGIFLKNHIYDIFIESICYCFHSFSPVDLNKSSTYFMKYCCIGIDNFVLGFFYEKFFIISCHLFSIRSIYCAIDEVECKKSSFSFLFS